MTTSLATVVVTAITNVVTEVATIEMEEEEDKKNVE